jgi:hypothetical protein
LENPSSVVEKLAQLYGGGFYFARKKSISSSTELITYYGILFPELMPRIAELKGT